MRTHPDEATRRRAYEAEMVAWESVKEPLAEDLAVRFGIDLRSPEFWENSLNVIARRVDRYELL